MSRFIVQPGIMEIALYQSGQSALAGVTDVLKLSANENPYGPGEATKAAFEKSGHQLHRYPLTDHGSLRSAIAEVHGLDADQIICGVGSDEVLQFIAQCFAGEGDEIIYTEHGFSMYPLLAHACGATPVKVAEKDRQVDVDAILAACTDNTRIVFIANPGNPTSTMIGEAEVARLADGLPQTCLLVLDGAYAEFVDGFDGGASMVQSRDNVIMTRTFSKIYGLGGLRIGWGYAPKDIIDVLSRVRQPFNLSDVQLVTAEAAVRDQEYVAWCRSENQRHGEWLRQALIEAGVSVDPSFTNFILARFASVDEADACDVALKAEGIIVRKVGGYGLPNCLRITIGDESACRRVAHTIKQFEGAET